jgi:ABC-2 type transport system permease protein
LPSRSRRQLQLVQAGMPVADGTVAAATGGLLLAAYVAAVAASALLVTERRDVA